MINLKPKPIDLFNLALLGIDKKPGLKGLQREMEILQQHAMLNVANVIHKKI